MHMCRYNESANVGTLRGYIQATDTALNSPELQGWRLVFLQNERKLSKEEQARRAKLGLPPNIRLVKFLPVKKGFLVDLLNGVCDQNKEDFTPKYPV